jgi:hypothetical protein
MMLVGLGGGRWAYKKLSIIKCSVHEDLFFTFQFTNSFVILLAILIQMLSLDILKQACVDFYYLERHVFALPVVVMVEKKWR